MNDTFTIEQLFTKTGTVNSAITRRETFKQSNLYNDIITSTEKYNSIIKLTLGQRIQIYANKVLPQYCDKCGSLFFKFNGYLSETKSCNCKLYYNNNSKNKLKQNRQNTKNNFIIQILNDINNDISPKYNRNTLKQLNINIKYIKFGFNSYDIAYSIIYATKYIKVETDLKIAERWYNILNDIDEIKFNVFNSAHYSFSNGKYRLMNDDRKQLIIQSITDQNFTLINFDNENKLHKATLKCNKCGKTFTYLICNGRWSNIYCAGCYGDVGKSKIECEIVDYLKSLNITNIKLNDKTILSTGKEIDIYLPDYNLGIELCGVLWHSYGSNYPNNMISYKTHKHHMYDKHITAYNQNILLLSIYDTEWIYKQQIIKNILKAKLGICKNKIFARKTHFKQISKIDAADFLNKYHLQGSINDLNHVYGLYYNDILISIAAIGTRQISKTKSTELLRFCTLPDYFIVGGLSKLMNNICKINNIDNILTYCDARYSNGDGYTQAGFKFLRHTKPNYFYTKNCIQLYSRNSFQKHKLQDKLDNFDKNLTEVQNMINNGYRQLFDCGNFVYMWNN